MSETGARWTTYESPIGPLTLVAGPRGLTELSFPGRTRVPGGAEPSPLPEATRQLDAYFAGERREFDLPLDLRDHAAAKGRLAVAAGDPLRGDRELRAPQRRHPRRPPPTALVLRGIPQPDPMTGCLLLAPADG